jgi:hypothetical protein
VVTYCHADTGSWPVELQTFRKRKTGFQHSAYAKKKVLWLVPAAAPLSKMFVVIPRGFKAA